MVRSKKLLQLGVIVIFIGILFYCWKSNVKLNLETQLGHFSSAAEMVNAIRQGKATSVELLNLHLDRIQRYNDGINAIIALDVDAARKRAAEADKAIEEGKDWGPLHGLPMTVKDVFEVVGMPVTSGDPKLKDYIPERNAIAVQRLIDAGAIIFGKTNVPFHAGDNQTYNEIYGTTNNPWDLSRTPGGSSGGSTAALAVGLTPLELGSDIGGSLRNPAHYTGTFGHKPSFGIIPRYGHIPPMPGRVTRDAMPAFPLFVVGPLARSADDLELALNVLTTPNSMEDGTNRLKLLPPRRQQFKDYRVAVWFSDPYSAAEIDDDVLAVLKRTVKKLRGVGLDIDEKARPNIDLMSNVALFNNIFYQMMLGILQLNKVTSERQKKLQTIWAEFFERYDVLLAPISPTVAFPHDQEGTFMSRRFKINGQEKPMHYNLTWAVMVIVSGLPATVAPVGLSDSGMPVGIQIISNRLEDRTTIDFARGLSVVVGGFKAPPGYQ